MSVQDDKPESNSETEQAADAGPSVDDQQAQADERDQSSSDESSNEEHNDVAADDVEDPQDDQVQALKDQLLRQMAEVENVKRRASRDVENAHKFATEKLLNELFPILDSLEKAVETAAATEGAEAIAEGVELSLKLFVDTLGKNGVEQIDPLGEPFDPQRHEAMTMVPNPSAEPNSVMDVMAKGYVLNGRLVRAAKVIVVKGD